VYKTLKRPKLTYGSEAWATNREERTRDQNTLTQDCKENAWIRKWKRTLENKNKQ